MVLAWYSGAKYLGAECTVNTVHLLCVPTVCQLIPFSAHHGEPNYGMLRHARTVPAHLSCMVAVLLEWPQPSLQTAVSANMWGKTSSLHMDQPLLY
jgi:hypothetical protein